jgi:hypothetical protein
MRTARFKRNNINDFINKILFLIVYLFDLF